MCRLQIIKTNHSVDEISNNSDRDWENNNQSDTSTSRKKSTEACVHLLMQLESYVSSAPTTDEIQLRINLPGHTA